MRGKNFHVSNVIIRQHKLELFKITYKANMRVSNFHAKNVIFNLHLKVVFDYIFKANMSLETKADFDTCLYCKYFDLIAS